MHLVPAPAVRLMKRRVLSRPGVYSLMFDVLRLVYYSVIDSQIGDSMTNHKVSLSIAGPTERLLIEVHLDQHEDELK